ncbi:U4/U6-U5 snRNP complex subunit PRP38 Ecym_5269 [Eremothecium cymbalariae DBVPG|uniref:Pre-mRNA-splicing factor 38 n=1 Tax=Eremothecium cymbalariae (strain CBS 270.75 / DBVPG 7215 / KCTC 17166 / NRRL Y-17582) TaxID=931890 RepID=I6ND91_ERECY|nr:hypothetical protein Ecym_5269 [Eremothecium cymbalariae DBVPG\
MSREFQVESEISDKQLNHQSTSLVIPKITRLRIHNSMYYKVNLHPASLRGETMKHVSKVMIRELGTCKNRSTVSGTACGTVEFQCLLMKMVEIRPTWSQLHLMLQLDDCSEKAGPFNNKYIVVLILVYLRIQYYYLVNKGTEEIKPLSNLDTTGDIDAGKIKTLFAHFLRDCRKIKSINLHDDPWSTSIQKRVDIYHIDEIVDWLCTNDSIWGVPLGKCPWLIEILEAEADEESDGSDHTS